MTNREQEQKIEQGDGFVAALDQSGGSTPKALGLYGIGPNAYASDGEMFDRIHEMRARIIKSAAFNQGKVIGAILFEKTMDRDVGGKPTAQYLWEDCNVVGFLKIDKGLMDPVHDVQLMKPIDGLEPLLDRAKSAGIYGTKMRSVIGAASPRGISAIVAQQFEVGQQVLAQGLMPILEPEINIAINDKAQAETLLLGELKQQLDAMPKGQRVMLKLTLPDTDNLFQDVVHHPAVMKIVALSGGYTRADANAKLARNTGVIASFSRALTEGLNQRQSDAEFDALLGETIDSIYRASVAG